VRADGSGVVTDGVKMSVNPFCEIALEEALRIRENGRADEIVVVSVGPAEAVQQLRTGLALGADRAIHVPAARPLTPLGVARCLLALAMREQPFLILLGKQAIDDDNNQTGQLLAGLWNRPQATFASSLRLARDTVVVEREIDQGIEVLELDLPAVVTADLRLNQPRFVKLPQLLQAKRLPIESLELHDLGVVDDDAGLKTVTVSAPPARAPGQQVADVDALIAALAERKLI
jgi:electron transfer flavoprotein beta subunit